jgi:Holliday junction resolvase RusA-like endonuclease
MYEADKSAPIRLWKATVRLAAIEAGVKPITGPVKVDLFFSFPRPKSLMRKKDSADFIWHTKKPDRDNLDKAVLDALKGVAWTDDCQVCAGVIEKTYPAKGDARIGVEIYIGECEQ